MSLWRAAQRLLHIGSYSKANTELAREIARARILKADRDCERMKSLHPPLGIQGKPRLRRVGTLWECDDGGLVRAIAGTPGRAYKAWQEQWEVERRLRRRFLGNG